MYLSVENIEEDLVKPDPDLIEAEIPNKKVSSTGCHGAFIPLNGGIC